MRFLSKITVLSFWAGAVLSGIVLLGACSSSRKAGEAGPSVRAALPEAPALPYEVQRRFDELFLEAVRQKQKGNYDAEYELLEGALRLHPDAPEALYEMALLKISFSGSADTIRRAAGEEMLRRAVELAPRNDYYKEALGSYYAQRRRFDKAVELYEELAAGNPSSENLSMLVGLYEETDNYQGAIRTLERLEKIEGKSEAYSVEKFKIYTQTGDNEHAYAAIEELCAEYPADLRYRVLLGDLYRQNGYNEMALAIYRDVLTLEPENSFAQLSLLAYHKTSGEDSLYNDLVRKVVLNPQTRPEAKVEVMKSFSADNLRRGEDSTQVLSLFREALGQPQENRELAELYAYYIMSVKMPVDSLAPAMRRILDIEPDYSRARLQLLQILLRKDDMEAVAELCRDGRIYDPSQIVFYLYEGLSLSRLGRDEEAVRTLQHGTEHVDEGSDAGVVSDLYATLGDLLHESGDSKAAYTAYDSAITYNSENLVCLNNYAYFLSLEGQELDHAAGMSKRTIEAEPQNPTYLDTYAWILYRQRRYTQARIYIDQTLKYAVGDASDAGLYEHAGDIYYRCGERTQAVAFWRKALSLSDDAAQRAVLKRKIRNRRP